MNALLITGIFGVIMMFSGILLKSKSAIRNLAILGLIIVFVANVFEITGNVFVHIDTKGMLVFDRFGLLFNAIVFGSTLVYFVLSARDIEKVGVNYGEYFALIFFVLCGASIASSFHSLFMLFLGIEIISIPLYILTGSDKRNLKSNEASLKYFLLGAFSTGLMLMGIALVYGATGTFDLLEMLTKSEQTSPLFIAGMLLLMFSMAFKVSAAPFHFWTPDVYDGAPTVFTSFMATIVKIAGFVAFIRLFNSEFGMLRSEWRLLIAVMTAVTLFIGNITAVFQQSVKRMLAYSSISQAGFMMMAVYAMNSDAKEGLLLYSAAYSLATIGIFAILIKLKDYSFDGFNAFSKQQPLLAATMTIFLLSLAGIPLTAGFLSKFYMLKAILVTGQNFWLAIFAVLMAAVSIYYYFRVIQAMYFKGGTGQVVEVSTRFKVSLVILAGLIVILGIFPNFITYWLYF